MNRRVDCGEKISCTLAKVPYVIILKSAMLLVWITNKFICEITIKIVYLRATETIYSKRLSSSMSVEVRGEMKSWDSECWFIDSFLFCFSCCRSILLSCSEVHWCVTSYM